MFRPSVVLLLLGVVARTAAADDATALTRLGWHVSGGAAPGYVEDKTCATCHRAVWDSYQEVGMARSFFRPSRERAIEDFTHAAFTHEESGDRYTLSWRGDALWFTREQLDGAGKPLLALELQVEWILGSGHHARTYLYRSGNELYQLPIAWYSATASWGMAPGYDRADHSGMLRQVRRECIVCHNAYPDVPVGSDHYPAAPTLPVDLPQGTGCQRCHGPGAAHSALALDPAAKIEAVRASIVDPAKLAPSLRDDVCNQCHLQPTVALPGVRRFGVGDYAYRPGTPLSEHMVQIQGLDASGEDGGRFEINQHAVRLRSSRCAASNKLACITCHDPHRRLAPAEKVEHFRRACLTCHTETSCTRHSAKDASRFAYDPADAANDCASCHMPKRRPDDVVHVVVTDHRIQRHPPDDLLAARAERDPVLTGAALLEPATLSSETERELYRMDALARVMPGKEVFERLATHLAAAPVQPREARFDLALVALQQRRFADAETVLRALDSGTDPATDGLAREWLAVAQALRGDTDAAIATLRKALTGPVERAESRYNLGRWLLLQGDAAGARAELARAVELRPNLAAAWLRLGDAERALAKGDATERVARSSAALDDYRRALALNPRFGATYLALADALLDDGKRDEALRILRHGSEHADDPAPLSRRVQELAASRPKKWGQVEFQK